jgi:DNA-binding transcriptional MerR regulator
VDDRYLTTVELADMYRTTPSTIRYWRHTGYGPQGVKVGKRVLYAESEIRRWDEGVRAGGGVPA